MTLQPSTYLRESCASVREGRCEALTAAHVAGAIEHRKNYRLGCRDSRYDRRQHVIHRNGERDYGPTVSKNPGTHARTGIGLQVPKSGDIFYFWLHFVILLDK